MWVAGGLFIFVILASTAGLAQLSGYQFSLDRESGQYLERGPVAEALHRSFEVRGHSLNDTARLVFDHDGGEWYVEEERGDGYERRYRIKETGDELRVYQVKKSGIDTAFGKAILELDEPDAVLSTVSPIIAYITALLTVVFGFSSITSELNSKTIDLLVTKPTRAENIITGKFLGITAALGIPVTLCIPACMIIIRDALGGIPSIWGTLGFWFFSIIFIGTFVLFSLLFATLARSTGTSVTLGISLFLVYTFFWSLITYVVQYLIGCDVKDVSNPSNLRINDTLGLLNPVINYQNAVALVFDSKNIYGVPVWLPAAMLVAMMILLFFVVRALFARRIRDQDY